ncbi:MAG: hypothetical protein AB8B57_06220 [Congregibacter sp.]
MPAFFAVLAHRCLLLGSTVVVLTLGSVHTQAQVRIFTDLQAFNEATLETAEVFVTSADNIAKADEEGSPPGSNRGVGTVQAPGTRTLTFDRDNTGLEFDFTFIALNSENLTFDDDEGDGNLPNFDDALSPGDIDNNEDDDWSLRTSVQSNRLRGFGFFLQDNNGTSGETIRLFTSSDILIDEVTVPGGLPVNSFIGVVSETPFVEIRYDEGAGGDDIAVKDFHFVVDRTPTTSDIFAATPVNTTASPQAVSFPLAGSEFFAVRTVEYQIVSPPSHGELTDSQGQTIGNLRIGQDITYTPDIEFTGIDTFEYRPIVANQFGGRNGTIAVATVTVFDAFRSVALQLGDDIDGEASVDFFGEAVALSKSGSTLAVGAPLNDGNGDNAGHVRVFSKTGAAWTQIGPDIDGSAPSDEFGSAVALSAVGTTLAVGASKDSGAITGYVRVFDLLSDSWEPLGDAISGHTGLEPDERVASIDLSADGRTVAIGLLNPGAREGRVRIFRWNGMSWAKLGETLDGERRNDESGSAIALSSDGLTVAIGASLNDGGANDDNTGPFNPASRGHVRVYRFDGEAWQQQGDDINGDATLGDVARLGSAVSLSGDGAVLAVGAPLANSPSNGRSGGVRVYFWNGSGWEQRGGDIYGSALEDQFGSAVSLTSNGSILAIGAVQSEFEGGLEEGTGYARIVRWTGASWVPVGEDIIGDAVSDEFGGALALSGDGQTLAVGAALHEQLKRGHVRVFDLSLSALDDEDADGLSNQEDDCDTTPAAEVAAINPQGCGPSERDGDNDGVNDRDDLFPDDPLDFADTDGDGLGDNREAQLGTDPRLADTDGDGFTDFDELEAETDPLSPADVPPPSGLNIILLKAAIDSTPN